MTIDNVKNMPNLSHTDNVGIIMDNFVSYYGNCIVINQSTYPPLTG